MSERSLGREQNQTRVVELKEITKTFSGVVANDHVNLELRRGEIHALLGENAAGKTTLMNILYGLYRPDSGEIVVRGKPVFLSSPRDAIELGIGMIHQHFMLVPSLTVAENVVLGLQKQVALVNLEQAERRINELSSRYELKVDPKAKVWQLSVGEQQRVEIIKALYRDAEILIMDEPTAVLTPQETKELFATLRRMAGEGRTVVFISHKLEEVTEISDRITVLRQGRNVATVNSREKDHRQLARMMVGRDVLFSLTKETTKPGARTVVEVEGLMVKNDSALMAVNSISFSIRAGEILGMAGVSGNGQRELAEALAGLRRAESGRVLLTGKDITKFSARELTESGVSYIPEDRTTTGLVMDLTVSECLSLKAYHEFTHGVLLDENAIESYSQKLISEFDIRTPGGKVPARTLSGGNLQKLILARELARQPVFLIASQPTRGLDVGATEYIRKKLLDQRLGGTAILLISEDLEEVLELSDRVAVMFEGQLMGVVPSEKADLEALGLMMAGAKDAIRGAE